MEDQIMSVSNFITYKEGYHVPDRVLKEFMEELRKMEVRPDDIFIATFPKSGTHWMQEIVNLILLNGKSEKIPSHSRRGVMEVADVKTPSPEIIAKAGPFLRQLKNTPSPRVLTTHASYDCLPKDLTNKGCKVIYVHRNPKDIIVSYYNHRRKFTEKELGISVPHSPLLFDDFFEAMTSKYNVYGGWFNHVTGYFTHRKEENIFVVSFEEMKEDLLKVIKQLSKFLDRCVDESSLLRIVEATSLDAMKTVYEKEQEENNKQGKEAIDATLVFSEGKVGQWQNIFSAQQIEQFDKMFLEKIHEEELLKAYGPKSSQKVLLKNIFFESQNMEDPYSPPLSDIRIEERKQLPESANF